ncbi:archaeosortase/exosortase family protein [Armatimonas sp.]|uniref:archaeosortase/exosortase family protein n=1 Tax=Armatimonas sp. TaxID=1872638 RepID=UPI003752199D
MVDIVTNDVKNLDTQPRKQPSALWWLIPPGVALAWIPFRICSPLWFETGSQLFVQAWVLPVVALLAWTRKPDWQRTAKELEELFPDPRNPRRSGNMILIALGSLGLILSQVASLPLVSILSLCLVIIGTIFYLFGPFLLRSVISPLLLLLLMVPPPHTLFLVLLARFQLAGATMLGGGLDLMGIRTRILGAQVTIQQSGWQLQITPSLSGIDVFLFVMFGTISYLMWKRIALLKSLLTLLIAAFSTVIINLFRLLLIGLVARQNPSVANTLASIPALPAILCALAVIFLVTRKLLSNPTTLEEK